MKVEQRRSRHIQRPTSTSRIVWRFGSHFRCVWKHTAHTFGFWAPRKADSYTYLNTLFRWGPGKAYKGRVLAQFERSTHPEHGGTRTVVIRTVKIFELLWAEDVPPDVSFRLPEEGGFALTRNLGRGPTRYVPWSVDVDAYGVRRYRKARDALKLLFDNEEMSLRGLSDH